MKLSRFTKMLIGALFIGIGFQINSMNKKSPSLSNSGFKAAGVLPYKKEGKNSYLLLSRESLIKKGSQSRDAGTYDVFGGKRDAGENHPVKTASREFAEESLFILGNPASALNYIDLKNNNTSHVIYHQPKQYAIYITKFSKADLGKLVKTFYSKMKSQKVRNKSEKDKLRWVKWSDLKKAIANSQPGQPAWVKSARVDSKTGGVLRNANGNIVTEKIKLRPIFISVLRPFFANQNYTPGKDPKIRFYN